MASECTIRIVSLLPSGTEILCSLGLRENLKGISHACDYPPGISGLPVLTEPKMDPSVQSERIDESVRNHLQNGSGVYRIKTEVLKKLSPDLIVTQDQCDVCAVSLKEVRDALCAIPSDAIQLCTLRAETMDEIFSDIQRVADSARIPHRGNELVSRLRERLEKVLKETQRTSNRPSVACVEWLDPLMVAGGWMPELVRTAGGVPVLIREGELFSKPTWADLAKADPDIVVILPCGFDLRRIEKELEQTGVKKNLSGVRAVREGRCFMVDGNAYFNRPGPRIVESTEIMASLIHPSNFPIPDLGYPYRKTYLP